MATFMSATAIAPLLAGPLCGATLKYLDGFDGLHGWQWLFISQGVPASLLGIAAYLYLQDKPEDASWLTAAEKSALRFQHEQDHPDVETSSHSGLPHDDLGRSVQDWVHGIGRKASGLVTSLSARQAERRIKKWTGHSRRKLQFYQRAERLLEQTLAMGRTEPQWSTITCDAGFSDQSHMIRDMRRLTGFSPKSLFGRLEEEPFWCYRLFGSHFASLVRADSAP